MRLNAEFEKRVLVRFDENDWIKSPSAGVERKMLDRIGEEVARATTIVRFAPGSAFSAHTHDGGEEYLVLEGTFQDEDGDFPVGSYVRNPPTTSHTPAARDGAMILVKLHQFDPKDRTEVHVDSAKAEWQSAGAGLSRLALHEDARETVFMEKLEAGTARRLDASGGLELLVIEGSLSEGAETLGKWDWLRLPVGSDCEIVAGADGATFWAKTGHLRHVT